MNTVLVKKENLKNKKPSLLRQIMDEVDYMDEGDKKLLLFKIKQNELLTNYKILDEEIAKSEYLATNAEIDKICSQTRKELYEEKMRLKATK